MTDDEIRAAFNPILELADDYSFVGRTGTEQLLEVPKTTGPRYFTGFEQRHGSAFDANGNLFVADRSSIYEFTPSRVRSIFASGLPGPNDLPHVLERP